MNCNKGINNKGKKGDPGASAYEIAVDNGFIGTEQEWLNSLKGEPGADGVNGLNGINGINGINGLDGQSSFTSYVFTTTLDGQSPQRPSGGSYQNPLPIEDIWTDGPTSEPGTLYLSYRIFTSDGLPPQQSQWSVPVIASDSSLVDFEWSSIEANPGNPTDNPENWSNTASNATIWMAVRTLNEGSWSNWNIVYIKGEKGDTGEPGVATAVIYSVNGSWTDAPTLDRADRYPTGWDSELPTVNIGEYVWMAQAMLNPITDQLLSNWTDPIRLSGEKGENGSNGASIAYRGDWDENTQYQGNNIAVDFVIYDNGSTRDGYLARIDADEIPIGTLPTDTDYWNGPIENVDALFTDFLIAYSAYIQNLTVGSLRTAESGSRLEILENQNKLNFYFESLLNPSLEIGIKNIQTDMGFLPPDPTPVYEDVPGLYLNRVQVMSEGLKSTGGDGVYASFYQSGPHTGSNMPPYEKVFANIIGTNSFHASGSYGGFFNSIFIEPNAGGITVLKGIDYTVGGFPYRYYEPKKGWTGTHNGMEYIDGIAVGPA